MPKGGSAAVDQKESERKFAKMVQVCSAYC